MENKSQADAEIDTEAEALEKISSGINVWKWTLVATSIILIAAYCIYFGIHLKQELGKDAEKWGQFGDFFGGLLNPLVAFAAFYWLTQSVKIQKKELSDTQKELAKAAAAQRAQVKQSEKNIRIAALSAMVNYLQPRINKLEDEIDSLNTLIEDDKPRIVHLKRIITNQTNLSNEKRIHEENSKRELNLLLAAQRNRSADVEAKEIKKDELEIERNSYLGEIRLMANSESAGSGSRDSDQDPAETKTTNQLSNDAIAAG